MLDHKINIIKIVNVDSTNSEMKRRSSDFAHSDVLSAHTQTAGRGQRGNTWESEPGANVVMSMMLRPTTIKAASQFCISEAVSLAITDTLKSFLPQQLHSDVSIKWPNDIYVADSKICGMLIENVITGSMVASSIPGIGLNVNQREFHSDAPNPVSMWQLSGKEYDVSAVTCRIAEQIAERIHRLETEPGYSADLHEEYTSMLWRREGMHLYRDNVRGELIPAAIDGVDPTGILTLRLSSGERRHYAFKEVMAVLN